MYTVGFTGTQLGMTLYQKPMVVARLQEIKAEHDVVTAMHGHCIGADDDFGTIAFNQDFTVIVRPGCDVNGNTPKRGQSAFDEEYPPEPYLVRNKKIVDGSDILLATPKEMEEVVRSGTWSTIRYARRIGKPVEIFWPKEKK